MAGLTEAVEIVRDADGVPHIFAETDADAFFGLGYVHAQDRMWQMEMSRRIGAGRLSEVMGERTLETDKFLRTLGVYRAVQSSWEAVDERTKNILEAYAAGVNAWLSEGNVLPLEFWVLQVEPELWTVYDSLVWSKMMAWDLGGDYDLELLRSSLAQTLGSERMAQLMPRYPRGGIDIMASAQVDGQAIADILKIDSQLQDEFHLGGMYAGSNNWVVAGTRTETGLPMLANDPHLGASIPSVWYLAEIKGENIHVTGATLPGLPGVPTGHNQSIAWGVTNVDPDVQDLFMERINPDNPRQYNVDGTWVDIEVVEELIRVKGQEDPVRWAARSTRHGPLISDVSDTNSPMALRWTALDEGDTSIQAFLKINYAQNWAEFVDAMRDYVVPSQNFVFADVTGNIGYFMPGKIPIRKDGRGLIPVPGWNSQYEWTDYIAFENLPQVFNPPEGYVVTANNRVISDNYPFLISNDWSPPYRAARIVEMIDAANNDGELITMADMMDMQADQTSVQVDELLPLLLELEPTEVREADALSQLRSWDGTFDRDSAAAAIYRAWFVHLGRAMFADELQGDLYDQMARRNHPTFLVRIFSAPEANAGWCDNVLSVDVESCQEIAQQALVAALDDLQGRMGEQADEWQWGKIHPIHYKHNPFTQVAPLRPIFNRKIANGGDTSPVNVGPVSLSNLYEQGWVASYRHIVDLSELNSSLFMHTTGQSGNIVSDYYDNLIERHRDVDYLPMTFGREEATGTLFTLEP